jgi:RNA polymerase sigma-70 factor (ECF subfamily)
VGEFDPDELFRTHGDALRRFLARRVASPETAADLAQEAFLRLLRAAPAAVLRDPRAYLYRTALNLLTDQRRSAARDAAVAAPPGPDMLEALPDPAPSPERHALSREELEVLRRAIDTLPERRREIFLMHKLDNLGYAEIAERLGIAKNTVEVQMVRALAHCRQALDRYRRSGGS